MQFQHLMIMKRAGEERMLSERSEERWIYSDSYLWAMSFHWRYLTKRIKQSDLSECRQNNPKDGKTCQIRRSESEIDRFLCWAPMMICRVFSQMVCMQIGRCCVVLPIVFGPA